MASPQLEDGYTRIANEIMEALAKIRIPGRGRQVLDVILRKTYGFNKREDAIALSQFCLATGLIKPRICEAIKKLEAMNLITIKRNGALTSYRFNKDFDLWQPLRKSVMVTEKRNQHYGKTEKALRKSVHTKENKKNITKEPGSIVTYSPAFLTFYESYPKKVKKLDAFKAWGKIAPQNGMIEKIMVALELHKGTEDWKKDNGNYIPHPATWLNGHRWEDEIERKKAWNEL